MREGVVRWPQTLVDRYVAAGYWRGRPLGAWMWQWATRSGERVAVVDGDVRLTYRELAERADGLAVRLAERGVQPGDNILVQLPNCWEFVVLTLACFRLGATPIMALPGHRYHELLHLAEHGKVKAVAVPDRFRGFDHQTLALQIAAEVTTIQQVLTLGRPAERSLAVDLGSLLDPEPDPAVRARLDRDAPGSDDVALFLLSGGTTGLPKLIPRTHDDYEYNARRSGEVCGFDETTVFLVALPAGHNFPLACPGILGTLGAGGRVVMAASPDPDLCLATVAREQVTVTAVVPAVAQRWIDTVAEGSPHDLSSLRILQVGGARLASEVARRVEPALGCTLQQVFGMAEGLLNYTRLDDPDDVICETQGRPISPDDEVIIVNELDQPVAVGESGSLLTRGPYTLRGYYQAPEHNARSFTADGWYRTGDVVRWHPSGNLIVEGRTKDLINRAGEKISAEEVENLVYTIPDIAQVAAVATPDREAGERVCVCIVPRAGATAPSLEQIRAALRDRGAATFKLPERLVVMETLPLTNVGKIDKKRLRELITEGKGDDATFRPS